MRSTSYLDRVIPAALCMLTALLVGCDTQSSGFALPPGDAKQGAATFVELQCNQCHNIAGAVVKREDSLYPEVNIQLGGQVGRVKTYGELVTAIIHPSKNITRARTTATRVDKDTSIMPIFNDQMTVQQLVDLTTFLQGTYVLRIPEYRPMFMP